nr:PIN domain-containing protein [uncultured Alistipes sp.]
MDREQIFLHHAIYPNASDIFNGAIKPVEDIIDDCLFVIDTNVLLLPYTTSSSGFDEIKKAYSKIISRKQLLIPAQVAREFAKNRPEKIKTLFQQLSRIREKIQKPTTGQYPLLESLTEYKEAVNLEKEIQKVQSEYLKKIESILIQIKNWRWNDPISSVYKELFKPEFVKELDWDENKIIEELERRNKYSIPPGFNDKSKDDFGVGDLIIWLTILKFAKEQDKDVVFISGDEKNDWFYRSENQSLYPRFELITEFKNNTNQKSFHIIKLSQLLSILGAKEEAVKEVEIREINASVDYQDIRNFGVNSEKSVLRWLQETQGKSEILVNRGYPDFIIKDSEKTEGIDVLAIRDVKSIMMLNRLREKFMRAYYEINEGDFDRFRIFIVVQNEETISQLYNYLDRHSDRFRNEFIQIIPGVIAEDGNFIPVA